MSNYHSVYYKCTQLHVDEWGKFPGGHLSHACARDERRTPWYWRWKSSQCKSKWRVWGWFVTGENAIRSCLWFFKRDICLNVIHAFRINIYSDNSPVGNRIIRFVRCNITFCITFSTRDQWNEASFFSWKINRVTSTCEIFRN